jgi:biopolymer transport protein ExbB/TolQ
MIYQRALTGEPAGSPRRLASAIVALLLIFSAVSEEAVAGQQGPQSSPPALGVSQINALSDKTRPGSVEPEPPRRSSQKAQNQPKALTFAWSRSTTETRITVGVLGLLSFLSWLVIVAKLVQFRRAGSQTKRFLAEYRSNPASVPLRPEFEGSPAAKLLTAAYEEVERHQLQLSGKSRRARGLAMQFVRMRLESALDEQLHRLQQYMIVLSCAVSGGPFIGLFGTVWGVLETFAGIAQANNTNLTVTAPGMAGALIATLVGLFVAIPALFAYNALVSWGRWLSKELEQFKEEHLLVLKYHFESPNELPSLSRPVPVAAQAPSKAGKATVLINLPTGAAA